MTSKPHIRLRYWRDDPSMDAMEEDPEGDWVRREEAEALVAFIERVANGDFGLGTMAARNAREFLDGA